MAESTAALAEAVYLREGWALLDDCGPSEEVLADWQERAWEAADAVYARWRRALRVASHLSASQARVFRLRLLTAVSWLPAPDRDALRAYLTTNLPLEVLAALLRMPDHVFCELLEAATESLTAILTPTAGSAARRPPIPAELAVIGGRGGRGQRGAPGRSPQDGPPRTAARALRVPAGPPAAALAPAWGPRPRQAGDQPHRSRRRAYA